MQIGLDCFKDEQLRSLIKSKSHYGDCEIKKTSNCIIYDTKIDFYLEENLKEVINVFSVASHINVQESDSRVAYLGTFLREWNIFNLSENEIQIVIKEIFHEKYQEEPALFEEKVTIRELFSPDFMEKNCVLRTYSWEDFCYNIKHINRFHVRLMNLELMKELFKNMALNIPKGSLRLFRSRICDETCYNDGYTKDGIGAPPISKTMSGRTNSEGIQCLYLTNDEESSFHEVRARDHDHVCVGKFLQMKDLNIVDLSLFDNIGPFSLPDFDMTWFAINIGIIRKIGNEVAKPMRRFDRIIDYVPTQYICDFIKHLGYDGIKFKSTFINQGINYAIFNDKTFECIETRVAKIRNVEYHWAI